VNQNEAFLFDQVPSVYRAKIPSTLKRSYAAARVIIDNEPILNVPSACDNWGRIIQWSVDFGFQKLVESGEWPYDFRWRPFALPTGRYLEIRPSHSVITISQCADPTKQPRDVVFRSNKRLNNQLHLKGVLLDADQPATGLPHILLIHGYQELNFAHLAIPNEKHSAGYLYRTQNLMLMPHEVAAPEPAMEDTDYEAVLTLKDEIDRWRRDNGID
jgi:hypothetical protein